MRPHAPIDRTRSIRRGYVDPARTLLVATTALLLAACFAALGGSSATGATASVVVGATVPSATNLSTGGCTNGSAALEFGLVMPGSSTTTSAACTVTFGSSNDTGRLTLYQQDHYGDAMHLPARGPLDAGWGTAGITIEPSGPGVDDVRNMAVADDGSVYVVAFTDDAGAWPVRLQRFLPDGNLDPGFGTGGVVVTPMTGDPANRYEIGIAIQDDGKVVVAGYRQGAVNIDFAAARYMPTTGAVDTSFGAAGVATIPVGSSTDWAEDVVVDSAGRIILIGAALTGGGVWDFAAVRLHPDGSLDTNFGTNGATTIDSPSGPGNWDFAFDGAIDSAGRILLIGSASGATDVAAVLRLTPNGAVDTSYGVNGWDIEVLGGQFDLPKEGVIDSAGRLVVTGKSWNGTNYDSFAYRLTDSGGLDTTWGAAGWFVHAAGVRSTLSGITVLGDDSVVMGGSQHVAGVPQRMLVKLLPDGTLDPAFGSGGIDLRAIGAGASGIDAVASWRDGSLVAAGYALTGANEDMALTMHEGVPVNDYDSGTEDWTAGGTGMFGACLESVSSANVGAGWSAAGAGACTASDAAPWRPVADDGAAPTALVAIATPSQTTTATATMRWGFRPATNQTAGRYLAPLVFDVVAP